MEETINAVNNSHIDIDNQNSIEIISDVPGVAEEEVTPRDLLKFAKQILLWIAILFAISCFTPMLGMASVFEACKTILPPIATLVIGYYFGASR